MNPRAGSEKQRQPECLLNSLSKLVHAQTMHGHGGGTEFLYPKSLNDIDIGNVMSSFLAVQKTSYLREPTSLEEHSSILTNILFE